MHTIWIRETDNRFHSQFYFVIIKNDISEKERNSHEEDNRIIPGRRLCLTALTACGGSKTDSSAADSSSAAAGDDKTITVGATLTPLEILNAAKDALKAEGYTLNVVEFTDYVQPNTALVDGDLDANYFQHTPVPEQLPTRRTARIWLLHSICTTSRSAFTPVRPLPSRS